MNENVYIGEVIGPDCESVNNKLTVTSKATVQPVALMRLNVFVPSSRPAKGTRTSIDATSVLKDLEFSRREGYDDIRITGERLSMAIDFKVWVGIIEAFSKYGLKTNSIKLTFHEFAGMCRFESKRFDSRLRKSISEALTRIRGKTITFTRSDSEGLQKVSVTGLLKTGELDFANDQVELEADQRLWELYQTDYTVLLRHKPINALTRKEAAQALYTFIESLPTNPVPISFKRIRDRLSLLSPVKEQNRIIKLALKQLQDIGYLDHSITKKGKETFILIHSRSANLKPGTAV
ncbi:MULTISPECIES: RepB family plasmid replication initiator protein [Klebsiella/Raoultella group]|uniref:DNA replication n=2 Tax=Klebsiella TaxID=570 RepID=A0A4P0XKV3_KLEPN|nr:MULTISPECIES: RepB family plasmid replication initiator protein [Klebsiella/Raoultella group]ELA0208730.1 RepB family plasmid replication initiator protein [Klebsiella aerogenes]MCS6055546.1 replication initiation protein [Klebsiella variicola subsp. variicola]HBL6845766.1 RepB family plasmid replication initiator protein [Klebsiella oxytoca]HDU3534898.1 RepB family plasmid replication initiator protein [Klebsiella pneumoniae subsp. ozaenae]HDY0772529.1 RepB family plasmid replication initi